MKNKIAVVASVLAISAVWLLSDYRNAPHRPSDLRDALNDEPKGAIAELKSAGATAAPETPADSFKDWQQVRPSDDTMRVFWEFHYVRTYIMAVNIDWSVNLEKEGGETWTAGAAARVFKEALEGFKKNNASAGAPSKEAYKTVLHVNDRILRMLEETAGRLGGENSDHRAFGMVFNGPYEKILDSVAHSDSLSAMRSNADRAAAQFISGAEKAAFKEPLIGTDRAAFEKALNLCGTTASHQTCEKAITKQLSDYRRVLENLLGLTRRPEKSEKAAGGSERTLLKLYTEDGVAELTGDMRISEPYLVAFNNLRVKINGTKYRIASGSEYLEALCKPYVKKYPYTYERVETKGFLERVVFISGASKVRVVSGANVVVWDGACQRDQY